MGEPGGHRDRETRIASKFATTHPRSEFRGLSETLLFRTARGGRTPFAEANPTNCEGGVDCRTKGGGGGGRAKGCFGRGGWRGWRFVRAGGRRGWRGIRGGVRRRCARG